MTVVRAANEDAWRFGWLVVSVDALQSVLGLTIVCAVTAHGGRAVSGGVWAPAT